VGPGAILQLVGDAPQLKREETVPAITQIA
jgi:hypothetical protein